MTQPGPEGYRSLEHVTDAFIEAWGPSFEVALCQAGLGLMDTMVDTERISHIVSETLEVEGHDELELVYNWLEELLLALEIRRRVFREFKISPIESRGEMLHLRADARGDTYDPSVHGSKIEVKGVTYHLMEVLRESGMVRIKFLLDL